jgi:hypothetical protein
MGRTALASQDITSDMGTGRGAMSVITLEGTVKRGQIKLKSDIRLPDNTKVYVVIPGVEVEQVARIFSPRLRYQEQAADFQMEVIEDRSHANV